MAASQWFRSVEGALRTIAGHEAMNMIRKGQIRWLAKGDTAGQVRYIEQIFRDCCLTQSSGHHPTHWSKPICDRSM
jgi:hypothetical protein